MEKIKLDADQQKAVEHFQGPALVVAGPGSGKTTVIKERILHLIQKHKVDPEHILAIAFTNAAVEEMNSRFPKGSKPKICTLHVFGKDLIKAHYKEAGLAHEPNDIWDDKDIGEIIKEEKSRLKKENKERAVAIYKIEDKTTYQCYIGQTINPKRRKKEHFNRSSNRRLREAIQQKGEKAFDFTICEWVPGKEADRKETDWINSCRKHAAVNLNKEHEQIGKENSNTPIVIYKIASPNTVTCYFGQTTDLEGIDQPEGFEIIGEEKTWDQVSKRIELEIEKHKNWAVFNDEDPLHARDSTRRRIEVFCKYFNVSYDEVLEHTQKFEHEMRKFDEMNENIVKEKSKVYAEKFDPETISDPVLRAFTKRYEDQKTKEKAIDFLDMLILSANMLEKNQYLLREYREKHRYVFVDEFQDISPIDFRLIKLFSENLFAVGDDDQAIYGFRGGDSQIMRDKFGKQANVVNYEITRNYRSTSSIVKRARSLILHNNPRRFSKNLRTENSAQSHIAVLATSRNTVENTLLNELFPMVTTCETYFKENTPDLDNFLLQELIAPQKTGILARNWYEVEPIKTCLISELKNKWFQVPQSDSDGQEKKKLIMRRGQKEIVVSTIHSAKGREWEKVILLVNTIKVSLPDERNDLEDERRLFYVAVTRAKRELVVLNGGNCRFVSEFQNLRSIEIVETIESKIKKELQEVSQKALETLKLKFKKEVEKELTAILKQSAELNRLRGYMAEAENASGQMETDLSKRRKVANENLFADLIPVLDGFQSQIKNLAAITESNNGLDNLTVFPRSVQATHLQLLDSLKTHQFKPIETIGEVFNLTCHEKTSLDIYSDDVPAGTIAREERRGYLLKNQVIRKARVVVSRGPEFFSRGKLDWIVGRYLDRLTSEFRSLDLLNNVNEKSVKRAMVQYLTEQDDESVRKIHALACINERPDGSPADYCVGPEITHLCTDDVFRDFWKYMWEVVEQSKKISKPEIEDASVPIPTKRSLPSNDGPTAPVKTQRNTPSKSTLLTTSIELPKKTTVPAVKTFTDGEIVKGVVVDITRNEVMIDIGFKSKGYIPASEFDTGRDNLPAVQVGDEIDVYIVRREDAEGQIVLSKKIADQTRIWDEIATAYEAGTPVMGRIIERIKGGLRVNVGSLRGFLPTSQVELHPTQSLEQYVGQTLEMKVISLSKRRHNIVLSRRAWLEAELAQKRSGILNTLKVGQSLIGVVKNITNFGAFVDLGSVDGLIHISEMAWKRINHPSEVVSIGEKVKVKIIKADIENERIALSLKQVTSDPWENMADKYPVGSKVSGVVVNIVNYGAFVQLEEGIVGLIHVSEMPLILNNVSPLDLLNKDDELEGTVLKISKDSKRISLGIKSNQQNPFEEKAESDRSIPEESSEVTVVTPIAEVEETKPPVEEPLPAPAVEEDSSYKIAEPRTPEPVQAVDNNPPPMLQNLDQIRETQIQNLKPATLEPDITSEPPVAVNSNAQKTPQQYDDILLTQIQELKAEIYDPEKRSNITQEPTSETEIDRETSFTPPDSSTVTDSDTPQIKEQELSKNRGENSKKGLGYYLHRGGRVAREKIRAAILRKP